MPRHPLPARRRPRRPIEVPLDDGALAEPVPAPPEIPRWRSRPVELLGDASLKDADASSWFGSLFGP